MAETVPISIEKAATGGGLALVLLAAFDSIRFVALCNRRKSGFFNPRSGDLHAFDELKEFVWQCEVRALKSTANERSEELALVSASTTALLCSFDADGARPPFEVTLDYLLQLFSLEHGTIWELHDGTWLTLEAVSNAQIGDYRHNCLKATEGLVSRALKSGAPKVQRLSRIAENDLKNTELYSLYKERDIYLIRLGPDERPYGVACLAGRDANTRHYNEEILNTFEQFLALELQSRRKNLTNSLFKSIQRLFTHDEADLAGICRTISLQIVKIIDCQAVTIVLKENLSPSASKMFVVASKVADGFSPSSDFSKFEEGAPIVYDVDERSLTGSVADLRTVYMSNEVSTDERNSFGYREIADRSNDTWIGIPILTASKDCIGVLRCSGKMATIAGKRLNYVFDNLDQQLLTNAASILAPLLQHKHATEVLRAVNERLEDAERIKEHEMRGPLHLIFSQASFVMKHLEDSAATSKHRRLETILTNVDLCDTLLTSTKLPSPTTFRNELQEVNLKKLLLGLVEVLRFQIESRSPSQILEDTNTRELVMVAQPFMIVELQGAAPPVIAHRNLLQRAFYNIGSNAVKYAQWSEKGRLTITLDIDADAERALIQFRDNGVGVPEQDRHRIFEGHYRGLEAQKRPGQGLGLKIAKAIIEQHDGELGLIRLHTPTTFQVSLPLPPKSKTLQ